MKIDYHKFSREQVNDTMAGDNVTLDLLLSKLFYQNDIHLLPKVYLSKNLNY